MCTKVNIPPSQKFTISYTTEQNEVINVEDDADLQIAYAIALSGSKSLRLNINLENAPVKLIQPVPQVKVSEAPEMVVQPPSVPVEQQIFEDKDEEFKGKKGKNGGKKGNGVPRKALKSLIQHEMEKQSRLIFQ